MHRHDLSVGTTKQMSGITQDLTFECICSHDLCSLASPLPLKYQKVSWLNVMPKKIQKWSVVKHARPIRHVPK